MLFGAGRQAWRSGVSADLEPARRSVRKRNRQRLAAPPEERAQRRRRLTKGPSEFLEDRVDLPRAKGK
jgi:hypothetical protein